MYILCNLFILRKNFTLTNNTICVNAYFGKGYVLPLYKNTTNSIVKYLCM